MRWAYYNMPSDICGFCEILTRYLAFFPQSPRPLETKTHALRNEYESAKKITAQPKNIILRWKPQKHMPQKCDFPYYSESQSKSHKKAAVPYETNQVVVGAISGVA